MTGLGAGVAGCGALGTRCWPAGVGLGPEDPLLDRFRSRPSPGGRHLVPVWLTARPGESRDWCQPAVGWVSPQC